MQNAKCKIDTQCHPERSEAQSNGSIGFNNFICHPERSRTGLCAKGYFKPLDLSTTVEMTVNSKCKMQNCRSFCHFVTPHP